MAIRKSKKTEKSRAFWEDKPPRTIIDENSEDLPYLGEPVWESKYELTPALVNWVD